MKNDRARDTEKIREFNARASKHARREGFDVSDPEAQERAILDAPTQTDHALVSKPTGRIRPDRS